MYEAYIMSMWHGGTNAGCIPSQDCKAYTLDKERASPLLPRGDNQSRFYLP